MKKIFLLTGIIIVLAGYTMIITSCENSQSSETLWSVFDDDSIKVEDVVMSADEKELTNNQGEVNIVLTNNSDFELSYFCEDVCFQKKIGEEWYSWKEIDSSDQPSAEIEQSCMPHDENAFSVKSEQLLPISLKENGEYRIYLPFVYIKQAGE